MADLVNGPIELTSGQEVALSSMENPEDLPDDITSLPFDVPKLHEACLFRATTFS